MKKTHWGILNMSTINENHMLYHSWDMEHDRQDFFSFWTIFCLFTPPPTLNNPENQNFEKMEKIPGDIILQKCTINDNHMIYGSWDMKCTRQNFFCHPGSFFVLLPPYQFEKWKFQKNEKKEHLDISSFYTSIPKIMIICYTIHEIWHVTDVIVIFHFGLYFSLLPL